MPKKPAPKTEPMPELVYELEGAPPKLFVVLHKPSRLWWRPEKAGYTSNLFAAGTYTEPQARSIETIRGEDEAVPLEQAVRELLGDTPNLAVVQALASLRGGR